MTEKIDKLTNLKKEITKATPEIVILIEKKMLFFQDVIQKTILHVQKNKMLDVVGVSDVHNCINSLFDLNKIIKDIPDITASTNIDNIINILQTVNNELSSLFKQVGTDSFEDLLWICFGNNSVNTYAISDMDKHKFELLKKYFHPTSYKIAVKKDELTDNLTCVDIVLSSKSFHMKVYGIKLFIKSLFLKKSLVIFGFVDDVIINFLKARRLMFNLVISDQYRQELVEFGKISNLCNKLHIKQCAIITNKLFPNITHSDFPEYKKA